MRTLNELRLEIERERDANKHLLDQFVEMRRWIEFAKPRMYFENGSWHVDCPSPMRAIGRGDSLSGAIGVARLRFLGWVDAGRCYACGGDGIQEGITNPQGVWSKCGGCTAFWKESERFEALALREVA